MTGTRETSRARDKSKFESNGIKVGDLVIDLALCRICRVTALFVSEAGVLLSGYEILDPFFKKSGNEEEIILVNFREENCVRVNFLEDNESAL